MSEFDARNKQRREVLLRCDGMEDRRLLVSILADNGHTVSIVKQETRVFENVYKIRILINDTPDSSIVEEEGDGTI